jgi:hypothetical protein
VRTVHWQVWQTVAVVWQRSGKDQLSIFGATSLVRRAMASELRECVVRRLSRNAWQPRLTVWRAVTTGRAGACT